MGNMMSGGQGDELHVASFSIVRERPLQAQPVRLQVRDEAVPEPQVHLDTEISFQHMRGFLNGRRFEMMSVARDERLPLGKPVLWTFRNRGGMMSMMHPMHVHGVRFRVVERRGATPSELRQGVMDAGFKDTVLVFPGEEVKVMFTPTSPGLFLYHCHNLEHEDDGMMRNYRVV